MSATQVTVTATFDRAPGVPQSQTKLQWQLSGFLFDSAGGVVCDTEPIPFTLNASGHGSVVLWAVDDATSQPTGLVWTLSGTVGGQPFAQSYAIGLAMAPTVDVSALTPAVLASPSFSYATVASVVAETVRATGVEAVKAPLASPSFTGSPNGPTGTPLSNSTLLANTAYVDRAVAVFNVELLRGLYFKPTAALYETVPSWQANSSSTLITTQLIVMAIALPKGLSIGFISFYSDATPLSVGVNQWFSLYNSSLVQLATTTDDGATAWAANTLKTLAVAQIASGASATFTTTYTGLHYLGIMVNATTPPTIKATGLVNTGLVSSVSIAPILCGKSTTSLTAPTTFPTTATALTVGSYGLYGYVS